MGSRLDLGKFLEDGVKTMIDKNRSLFGSVKGNMKSRSPSPPSQYVRRRIKTLEFVFNSRSTGKFAEDLKVVFAKNTKIFSKAEITRRLRFDFSPIPGKSSTIPSEKSASKTSRSVPIC